jgi:hypothetical protein
MKSTPPLAPGPGTEDACPCGSTKKSKGCCWSANRWEVQPAGVLSDESAGAGLPKCFASPLGGCDGGITGEHYWSRTILEQVAGDSSTVKVAGMAFAGDASPHRYGVSSLVANILCRKHNSALSPLDAAAGRFFAAFRSINSKSWDRGTGSFALFAGPDIERWMLKVFLANVVAGVMKDGPRRVKVASPIDPILLRALFLGTPMSRGAGIYFVEPSEGRFTPGHLSFQPLLIRATPNEGHLAGIHVNLNGFTFVLTTVDVDLRAFGFLDTWYRPRQVWIRHHSIRRVIEFGWPGEDRREVVHLVGA